MVQEKDWQWGKTPYAGVNSLKQRFRGRCQVTETDKGSSKAKYFQI